MQGWAPMFNVDVAWAKHGKVAHATSAWRASDLHSREGDGVTERERERELLRTRQSALRPTSQADRWSKSSCRKRQPPGETVTHVMHKTVSLRLRFCCEGVQEHRRKEQTHLTGQRADVLP